MTELGTDLGPFNLQGQTLDSLQVSEQGVNKIFLKKENNTCRKIKSGRGDGETLKVGAQPLDLTGSLHTQKSWLTNRPVGGGIWKDCCTHRNREARPTSLFTETFCF